VAEPLAAYRCSRFPAWRTSWRGWAAGLAGGAFATAPYEDWGACAGAALVAAAGPRLHSPLLTALGLLYPREAAG
jgi:hypothetical protein